jgi:glycosyltransferase involved in cell wall biosynthesis
VAGALPVAVVAHSTDRLTPMAARPEVSVVIPTRDRWDLLSRSLKGALDQRDVSLEVIVVDDGSTEQAPGGLFPFTDRRVVIHRSDVSRGVAHARNTGIRQANADWVAFLDDDDLWAPAKLRTQLDRAAAARSDFVYSAAVIVDSELEPMRLLRPPSAGEVRESIRVQNAIPAGQSNVLATTSLLRELGGFDERLSMSADWEMWIRLATAGSAEVCPDVHVAWVIHDANMHRVNPRSDAEFELLASLHLGDRATRRRAEIFGAKWRAYSHRRAGERLAASREYLRTGLAQRSPGLLLRGVAVLGGEAVMGIGGDTPELPAAADVAWLDDYGST